MYKFTDSIKLATEQLLIQDERVHVIGLGVSYPNGADGTMGDLGKRFPGRVLDTPASESSTTGLAVGAAMSGLRPIIHHGRVEFALFAADQILTQASKWRYMYGGESEVPVTFRIVIGRQWGNGPQHSASHVGMFAGNAGLKVLCPASPKDAFELLIYACQDNNPVVFLEPRWLYQMEQDFAPLEVGSDPILSDVVREGRDITVVTYGEGVLEAILAARELSKVGVELEVIDLKCLSHVEYDPIVSSLARTRRLIAVDPYSPRFGVCSEIVSRLVSETSVDLKEPPIILSPPFIPVPTAPEMAAEFYAKTDKTSIIRASGDMMGVKVEAHSLNLADATFPPKTKIGETWEVL